MTTIHIKRLSFTRTDIYSMRVYSVLPPPKKKMTPTAFRRDFAYITSEHHSEYR